MVEVAADPRLAVRLLGHPSIALGGTPLSFHARRVPALVAYLALHRGAWIDRGEVVAELWPDLDDEQGRANLRRHVALLQSTLERAGAAGSLILVDRSRLAIVPAALDAIDMTRFEAAVSGRRFEEAARLYGGDLLEGCDEEWARPEVERLRRLHLFSIERVVELRRESGDRDAAIEWANRLLQLDPLHDWAVRAIVRMHLDRGDHARAMRAYESFLDVARREFGIEAPPSLLALRDELANAERTLPLPGSLTTFFGREGEIDALRAALERRRFVTLVGAPGVGKTRLAYRVAAMVRDRFCNGVCVAELASLERPEAVRRAIDVALGLDAYAERSAVAQRLAATEALVVLDNCEHVRQACAEHVAALLRAAPNVRVIATSREAIGLPGETVVTIDPLPVPGAAIDLFLDRVRAERAESDLSDLSIEIAARICRRLDGIPLAIELAAARCRSMALEELERRMGDEIDVLSLADERHDSLRASFLHSYELLAEAERQVFRALGVFRGSFTIDSVVAVAGVRAAEASRIVDALVRRSLVRPPAPDARVGRYAMLRPIREFALELLTASDELESVENAHAVAYTDPYLASSERPALDDLDNVRAALDRCVATGEFERAIRVCSALAGFWADNGLAAEARTWLEMSLAPGTVDERTRALAMRDLSVHFRTLRDMPSALAFAEEAVRLYRGFDDSLGLTGALSTATYARMLVEDDEGAREFGAESVAVAQSIGNRAAEARAWCALGQTHLVAARLDEANDAYARAFELASDHGGVHYALTALDNLCACAFYERRYDRAEEFARTAYERACTLGHRETRLWSEHRLASIALRRGDANASLPFVERVFETAAALGRPIVAVRTIEEIAVFAGARSFEREAAGLLGAAAALHARLGAPLGRVERDDRAATIALLRSRLGSERYEAAESAGRIHSLESAVDEARCLLAQCCARAATRGARLAHESPEATE